jgi:translocator protein
VAVLAFSLLCHAVWVTCFVAVLRHAFSRSLGTGFMVLCVPCYNVYYAFSQFEHRRKGLLISGWLGCFGLGLGLRALSVQLSA